MTASADRLVAPGPTPKELWLTLGLSVLLHGLLLAVVILVPHFRIGTYVTVPVSYTVNLVSTTPGGGRAAGTAPVSPSRPAPAPATRPAPAPAPASPSRPAPAPPPVAKPSEELTLPGKRPMKKAPADVEPSLRPPGAATRPTPRPAPAETRPQPPSAPVTPAVPGPPVASVAPPSTTSATPGTGAGKQGGIERVGGEPGQGSGGSALGYYLGLVDYKISSNWTPLGSGGAKDVVVVIRFRVLRSGAVQHVELETGSGDAGLDTSAMRAIRQSLPLPPFHNMMTEPFLDLRYRFVMERG
jgi:TonB family protein